MADISSTVQYKDRALFILQVLANEHFPTRNMNRPYYETRQTGVTDLLRLTGRATLEPQSFDRSASPEDEGCDNVARIQDRGVMDKLLVELEQEGFIEIQEKGKRRFVVLTELGAQQLDDPFLHAVWGKDDIKRDDVRRVLKEGGDVMTLVSAPPKAPDTEVSEAVEVGYGADIGVRGR